MFFQCNGFDICRLSELLVPALISISKFQTNALLIDGIS